MLYRIVIRNTTDKENSEQVLVDNLKTSWEAAYRTAENVLKRFVKLEVVIYRSPRTGAEYKFYQSMKKSF